MVVGYKKENIMNYFGGGKNLELEQNMCFKKSKQELEMPLHVCAIYGTGEWKDIVYPWDLIEINKEILDKMNKKIKGNIEKNVTIKGKVLQVREA